MFEPGPLATYRGTSKGKMEQSKPSVKQSQCGKHLCTLDPFSLDHSLTSIFIITLVLLDAFIIVRLVLEG